MMARPTTPYVNAGPTAIATGQLSRPARATMAPGRVSNKTRDQDSEPEAHWTSMAAQVTLASGRRRGPEAPSLFP